MSPARHAGDAVALDAYGLPDVYLKIIYPTRLSVEHGGSKATAITVLARADSKEAIQPLELVLPLPDEALAFVDLQGTHVPGRLQIIPGYPDAWPYDLRVVHGDTQFRAGPLRPYRVSILPAIRNDGQIVSVPELAFRIRLESRWEGAFREFAVSFSSVGTPYLLVAVVLLLVAGVWQQVNQGRRRASEKKLTALYVRLREQVKLDHWAEARREIERIRHLRPHYRDTDQLDSLVSAAESAGWRREQLYSNGLRAYKDRDWPTAVHAFRAVEEETPYYRDVRFLRRTAALYADLGSRDRSLRLDAARELGEVADLVDMTPLLIALGDRSSEVADAARDSFQRIGHDALDVLLGGLAHRDQALRQRAYSLIEGMGQSARDGLLGALRSSTPRITGQAAMLLIALGARQELAEALLWLPPEHQEGVVTALISEGLVACNALIAVLLKAPPGRQQVLINALAALKSCENIDHRLAERMRATKDAAQKELLQRALDAPATSFRVSGKSVLSEPSEGSQRRRIRERISELLDKGDS